MSLPNGTTPFWRTDPHPLDDYQSADFPTETDIVVIGAGYAGSSVVHHILAQAEKKPSIVILEARQACSGATGRNGGHMKPDAYKGIASLAEEYGLEAATEVAAFENKHVYAIRDFVEKEKIDCEYVVTKAIDVQLGEDHCKKVKGGYDRLIAAGCEPTKTVKFVGEGAEEFSLVKGAVGCFTYDAGHIWPYKLIMHMLEKAVAAGVNLQTHTPVSAISESSPSRWKVTTPRGTVIAKQVILATNAYSSALAPQYTGKIIPVRGTCSRIVVPEGIPAPRLDTTYTLRWNSWNYDYLIPRQDGSIVVGGARPAFIHDLNNWYNVNDDSLVLEPAAQYFDGYMQRNFKGWEDSKAYTDRVWTGIMGYSSDGLPHIGKVPGQEGQYILAGFTGHGMPEIFLAAEGIAKMVVKGVGFEETGMPRLFKTTQERLDSKKSNILDGIPKGNKL